MTSPLVLAQLRVMQLQLDAFKAALDALVFFVEMDSAVMTQVTDPAETCPKCGASGESQIDQSTFDGTKRRYCSECHDMRTLSGPASVS